jgi:hypothetical protein
MTPDARLSSRPMWIDIKAYPVRLRLPRLDNKLITDLSEEYLD